MEIGKGEGEEEPKQRRRDSAREDTRGKHRVGWKYRPYVEVWLRWI